MGTYHIITFMLEQGESGQLEKKCHIPFMMPFNGHQNQILGHQPSSEAVECLGLPLACQKRLDVALSFISTHRAKGKGELWPSPEENIGARVCAPAGDGVCSTIWCPPFPKIRLKLIPACMGTTHKVPPECYSTGTH